MMAVPVLIGVVDQADALGSQGVEEPLVLRGRDHPAPVHRQDRFVLFGHPPHGPSGVIVPDQGVVIDEDVRQPQPLDGGDLNLERPVGAGGLQRVTAEDKQHGGTRLAG